MAKFDVIIETEITIGAWTPDGSRLARPVKVRIPYTVNADDWDEAKMQARDYGRKPWRIDVTDIEFVGKRYV